MQFTQATLQREELVKIIKHTKADLNRFLKKIIRKIIKEEKDTGKIQNFFSYIYENIYHDAIFQKIAIEKKTIRLIEILATPLQHKSQKFRAELMKSIQRRSKFIRKKLKA